jgi:hypothetical protein
MAVTIVMQDKLSYTQASGSRWLYIFEELRKNNIHTILVGKQERDVKIKNKNIIPVKQMSESLLGKLLFVLQMIITILRLNLSLKTKFLIIRGYQVGALIIPISKLFNIKTFYDFHGYRYKEQIFEGELKCLKKFV